jgi:hypothetical protein
MKLGGFYPRRKYMTVRAEPVEAAQEFSLGGLFSMAAEHNAHCGFDPPMGFPSVTAQPERLT